MQCPHCGAEVIEGNRFCQQCRQRVVPADAGGSSRPLAPSYAPAPPPSPSAPAYGPAPVELDMRRPSWVTVVAILDFLFGGLTLVLGGLMVIGGLTGHPEPFAVGLGGFMVVFGGLAVATGIGMIRMQAWARVTQMVLSGMGLIQIPCGTLIGAFVLFYLLKPGVKVLFSGREASALTPREAQDVAALSGRPGAEGGGGMSTVAIVVAVIVSFFLIAMIGIIAAIAIPTFLHARIAANEAGAIGDTRLIISAQTAYRTQTGGAFGTFACLMKPRSCVSEFHGADFLGPDEAASTKQGYHRKLVLGADGQHFTYSAVPVTVGSTGIRAFCGDETGRVWQAQDGRDPLDSEGRCDESRCTPLL